MRLCRLTLNIEKCFKMVHNDKQQSKVNILPDWHKYINSNSPLKLPDHGHRVTQGRALLSFPSSSETMPILVIPLLNFSMTSIVRMMKRPKQRLSDRIFESRKLFLKHRWCLELIWDFISNILTDPNAPFRIFIKLGTVYFVIMLSLTVKHVKAG